MEHSCVQLDNLPDEILLIIFQKLHNCDVLYSFIGLNKRLDTIVNDTIFTRNLTLITSAHSPSYQFTDMVLDRFCREILPRINDKIERLNIESSIMERILLATNYPNLHALGLYNFAFETANQLFCDGSYLIRRFQNQISSLFINMKPHVQLSDGWGHPQQRNIFIFIRICTRFKNLQCVNFSSSCDYEQLTFTSIAPTEFSSNLLELHVVIKTIIDCLCLLDGQFNQLHTFYVTIRPRGICEYPSVGNDTKLPNLKCFSLIHEGRTSMMYDEIFVPLLRRMPNLEELSLYFVSTRGPIIDGDNLEKNIINHMTRLNKFIFNICSAICLDQLVNLPSNENIQSAFRNFQNSQIISFVDCFLESDLYYYHIYSYPYTWNFFNNITNNFPGGLFKYVREISLLDERPFQHEFFLRIAQSFPFINKLTLNNREPQENDNQQCLIIKYHHLTKLDLVQAHENYVEEFLNSTKTCLLNKVHLSVCYNSLQKATDDFTKDVTQVNCSKIIRLIVFGDNVELSKLKDYFPHAKIS
ncbi:unnamed protein product [Rotaria sp. Silwood2]|nr:unnamed protein product [Rotaria sp. Silwood2]